MKDMLSTSEAARLLGVAVKSVSNWIDAGDLNAGRTPGGHRRIARQDLVDFLVRQNLPVPHELSIEKKILIVDDEPAFSRFLSEDLQEAYPDCQILVAADGFTAGEMVADQRPNVVIVDLRMAGMDGFEVCHRIKARPETQSTRVIMVTAYPSEDVSQKALSCGASACLTKPLDRDALLAELAGAL